MLILSSIMRPLQCPPSRQFGASPKRGIRLAGGRSGLHCRQCMMARHPRARSLSSTGHYAAGCITVTLLAALSLILLRSPAAEKRCDLSSYDPASTEALDLKRCKLSTLPVAIAEFRRLKKLDLGFNSLQALPALPPSLEVLFLLANRFEEVAPLGLGSGLSQAKRPALPWPWP